jgi:CheY-like chemotaxis protein
MARVQATERPARPAEDQEAAKRCLVAIIEDDAEFRTMLRELLEEEQYRVVALANGAEALEALRGDALPNVILLDVSMPVMDGFDFLRFRNEDPQLAAVPVVLVTNAKPHERPTIGVNDVVRKPIDIDEILFAIKRYCV